MATVVSVATGQRWYVWVSVVVGCTLKVAAREMRARLTGDMGSKSELRPSFAIILRWILGAAASMVSLRASQVQRVWRASQVQRVWRARRARRARRVMELCERGHRGEERGIP